MRKFFIQKQENTFMYSNRQNIGIHMTHYEKILKIKKK